MAFAVTVKTHSVGLDFAECASGKQPHFCSLAAGHQQEGNWCINNIGEVLDEGALFRASFHEAAAFDYLLICGMVEGQCWLYEFVLFLNYLVINV
ncbi:hypothetical protein BDA96_07G119000 [Sorghum bicolor]|uniref:Uncharacterized protein n=2 Tax=Sorghum bicolor TaxID=4558 RepID=A0A921QM14_SORBI|nr:hypothetical protein BDA96_07G119000 [Sorghum bicolor]KXG25031.1 hypothetical protein SORBI_3007G112000 [Sorghum bicolor]